MQSNNSYLAFKASAGGAAIEAAFGTLDGGDFANEFDGDGLLTPDQLMFKVETIVEQNNDGQQAHMLVNGKILPEEMKRGKTRYEFSDDTFEPFIHLVKGVFFLTQRLLPLMNDGGRILNLSSGLARFALPGSPPTRP